MKNVKNELPWKLIISKLHNILTPEEDLLFNQWLEKDDNSQLFRQIEVVWVNVQKKVANYEPDVEFYWDKLSLYIQKDLTTKKILKSFYRFAAVAAVLFFVVFGGYRLLKEPSSQQQNYITYSTQNDRTTILLPDSSEVLLRPHTLLTYNAEKNTQREVNIVGEAYFKVKHDDTKPFLVNANGVVIKVHGTEFNVNTSFSTDKVLVSLIEGSISMSAANKDILLKPGEEGIFDKKENTISVEEGDIELATIWTENRIRFENKDLTEVCKYLSKWYGVNIQIDSTITETYSYTFTVKDQSLEEIIEIMSRINAFGFHFKSDTELVLTKK